MMDAAQRIRAAVRQVEEMRNAGIADEKLSAAVGTVKRIQACRFAGTYADLLSDRRYGSAALFFLEELYGAKDYAKRDEQFSRIAGAVQKFFPHQVVSMAVALAELHAMTEELDYAMAGAWSATPSRQETDAGRYVEAWRMVGRRIDRMTQLAIVGRIGRELAQLTRTPGLRMMLKMMRAPAAAAGLNSLQRLLEAGFDTFAALARQAGAVDEFLDTIQRRESALIGQLFESEPDACETQLLRTLGNCPVTK